MSDDLMIGFCFFLWCYGVQTWLVKVTTYGWFEGWDLDLDSNEKILLYSGSIT